MFELPPVLIDAHCKRAELSHMTYPVEWGDEAVHVLRNKTILAHILLSDGYIVTVYKDEPHERD